MSRAGNDGETFHPLPLFNYWEVNHEETSVNCSRGRGFDGRRDDTF